MSDDAANCEVVCTLEDEQKERLQWFIIQHFSDAL